MRIFAWVLRAKPLLREGAWVVAGQLTSAIAALVSIRIITELLGPQEFGRLTLLVGIAALALGLSALPKLQAVLRYFADWSQQGNIAELRRVSARLILRHVAIAAGAISILGVVVEPCLDEPWFTGLLVAALLVIDSVRSFELTLLNAARRQRDAAFIYSADAWSRPLMAIATVLIFGSNANAVLSGYIAGSALVIAGMRIWMRPEGVISPLSRTIEPISQVASGDLALAIQRYALPLLPLAVFGWISGIGDRYVVGGLLGLEKAGLYAAAYGLASRPILMLAGVTEMTFRPVLQNAVAAGDLAKIRLTKRAWLAITGTGSIVGVAFFWSFSDSLVGLFLADRYSYVATIFPWIALGNGIYAISTVFTRCCYVFDDTKAVFILTAVGSVVGIIVMIPGIYFAELNGAALSVPVYFGIQLLAAAKLADRAETRMTGRRCRFFG